MTTHVCSGLVRRLVHAAVACMSAAAAPACPCVVCLSPCAYRDNDVIHSWDLCNEPRNKLPGRTNNEIGDWVRKMAAVVKCIDHKHPVTVGSEGFFGPATPGKDLHHMGGHGSAWHSQWPQACWHPAMLLCGQCAECHPMCHPTCMRLSMPHVLQSRDLCQLDVLPTCTHMLWVAVASYIVVDDLD
jgi:pimeloyl-ACP methyl ester carboxylesterase